MKTTKYLSMLLLVLFGVLNGTFSVLATPMASLDSNLAKPTVLVATTGTPNVMSTHQPQLTIAITHSQPLVSGSLLADDSEPGILGLLVIGLGFVGLGYSLRRQCQKV